MPSITAASDPAAFEQEGYHASDLHHAHQQLAQASRRYLDAGGKDPELTKIAKAGADHAGHHVVRLAKWMAKRWTGPTETV